MVDRLLIWLYKDPLQRAILLFVLLLHAIFALALFIFPSFLECKKEHKPLVVNTVAFKAPSAQKKTIQAKPLQPLAKKSIAPQNQTQAIAKKESKPAPVKKQALKPTAQVKKQPAIADKQLGQTKKSPVEHRAKISDSLLKELEESISKLENRSNKTTASSKAITPVTLQIDTLTEESASYEISANNYTDALIRHLHRFLSLPDYGEVKIQLSLRQDGTVAKVVVLRAQSEKNRQYLESNLPGLRFPHFEGAYANKKESTFILTFCNEL